MERDSLYVTLDIPGFGEVKLRDTLILSLRRFFKGRKVGQALTQVGLLPLDAGNLIDASLQKTSLTLKQPSGSYEDVVSALKGLGYAKAKAEEAAKHAMANYPEAPLEDKIKFALNYFSV